jgi:hypothetical protein
MHVNMLNTMPEQLIHIFAGNAMHLHALRTFTLYFESQLELIVAICCPLAVGCGRMPNACSIWKHIVQQVLVHVELHSHMVVGDSMVGCGREHACSIRENTLFNKCVFHM